MIINKVQEREYDEDFDFFSFAGRVAAVGGTAVAGFKTYKEMEGRGPFDQSLGRNEMITSKAEKLARRTRPIEKSLRAATDTRDPLANGMSFSDYFGSSLAKVSDRKSRKMMMKQTSLDAIHKHVKPELFNEIQALTGRLKDEGFGYTFSANADRSALQIKTRNSRNREISFLFNPEIEGFVGEGLDTTAKSTPMKYYGLDPSGALSFFDRDVAVGMAYNHNFTQIMNGLSHPSKVEGQFRDGSVFAETKYDFKNLGMNSNPDLLRDRRNKARPLPWISKKGSETLYLEGLRQGFGAGSAADRDKHFLTLHGSPLYDGIGGSTSNDAKKILRNTQLKGFTKNEALMAARTNILGLDGSVTPTGAGNYTTTHNILHMNNDVYDTMVGLMKNDGIFVGDLAEEEALLSSKKAGIISDDTYSFTLGYKNDTKMSRSTQYIFDQMKDITGLSEGALLRKLSNGGFSNFTDAEKNQLRNIQIDSYENKLEGDLRGVQKAKGKAQARLDRLPADADRTTRQGLLKEVKLLEKEEREIIDGLKDSRVLGRQKDLKRYSTYSENNRGLMISDMEVSDKGFIIKARREKVVGADDKIFTEGDKAKRRVKAVVDNMEEYAQKAFSLHGIEPTGSLADVDMIVKDTPIGSLIDFRNSKATMNPIFAEAIRNEGSALSGEVLEVLDRYGMTKQGTREGSHNMYIQDMYKELDGIAKKHGVDLIDLARNDIGGGNFVSTHFVGYHHSHRDIGAGKNASVSERSMFHLDSMGATNTFNELDSLRKDHGIQSGRIRLIEQVQELMADRKAATFNVNDLSQKDMEQLFPERHDGNAAQPFTERKELLKKMGNEQRAIIDLGEHGRVTVFDEQLFSEYMGTQIGSSGMTRTYSDYENATKRLIEGARRGDSSEIMKKLKETYDEEFGILKKGVSDRLYKFQVKNSVYGPASSALDGMSEYAEMALGDSRAQVHALNKQDFINLYGKKSYDSAMKQANKYNKALTDAKEFHKKILETGDVSPELRKEAQAAYEAAMDSIRKEYKGKMFGELGLSVREPSISGMATTAVNHVPAEAFGSMGSNNHNRGIVYTNTQGIGDKSQGLDHDGDTLSEFGLRGKKSQNEMFEYLTGHKAYKGKNVLQYGRDGQILNKVSDRGRAYKEAQEIRDRINLKGKQKVELLDKAMTQQKVNAMNDLMKKMEKSEIGGISNKLKAMQFASKAELQANPNAGFKDWQKHYDTSAFLHTFEENVIKAKYQTLKELQEGKALSLMETLAGTGVHGKRAKNERVNDVHNFMSELIFGDDASKASRAIAKLNTKDLTARDVELANNYLYKAGYNPDDAVWIHRMLDRSKIKGVMDVHEKALQIKDPVEHITKIANKYNVDGGLEKFRKTEDMKSLKNFLWEGAQKGGKNMLKYAAAPLVGIGLAGSFLGGTSEISSRDQYSDSRNTHNKTTGRPPGMKIDMISGPPKYQTTEISGMAVPSQMNWSPFGQEKTNVHLTDHSSNMDKYEIAELVERGF